MNEEIKNLFAVYLKEKGHRITNERILILNSALGMNKHFDADELYLRMKKDFIRVSRATVYSTLELMSDCNILTKHNFKGDRARYETKYGRNNHFHIICVSCNKIIEFENKQVETILNNLCKSKKLKILDQSIQLFVSTDDKSICKRNHKK